MSENTQKQDYLVLARKYRPRTFDEVIGQGALVRTLKNAIESNRLHHAYVLQGIRGTGKTTTARILAKVLNCESGPATSWPEDDAQALAIEKGAHVDVLEFDAASHTGVDDIRDLFEGVHYAPVQGRYKVYIIDEVHMLSKQAFNALLKTLEEPPSHVKFIFATTEVNKIPVTVLSRCQRFDLKRIGADELSTYFCTILEKEAVQYDEAAVKMIARAADGSARDGLSLLDQAIALSVGSSVSTDIVSGMLGMADRAMVYDLLDQLLSGDIELTLAKLSRMYEIGFDPLQIVADVLSALHLITRLKVVPNLSGSASLSEIERTKGGDIAAKIGLENLSRAYQMLLTVADEARRANRPFEAVEMGLIRATHMAPVASVSKLLEMQEAAPQGAVKKPQDNAKAALSVPKVTPVIATPEVDPANSKACQDTPTPQAVGSSADADYTDETFTKWRYMLKRIKQSDDTLSTYLAQNAKPISIQGESFNIFIPKGGIFSPEDLIAKLKAITHKSDGQEGGRYHWHLGSKSTYPTVMEVEALEAEQRKSVANTRHDVKQILETFPGAQVVKVDKLS